MSDTQGFHWRNLGSVPFLLREHLSYSQLAIFALAQYPYSLKLLWSPIVDAIFLPNVGRRKSWIIPMQLIIGSLMLWIANNVQVLLDAVTSHFSSKNNDILISMKACGQYPHAHLPFRITRILLCYSRWILLYAFWSTATHPFVLDIAVDGIFLRLISYTSESLKFRG